MEIEWTWRLVAQIWIVVLSIPSMFLLTSKVKRSRRWGGWLGAASQPGYLYAEFVEQQWGMLIVTAIYTALFIRAIVNNAQTNTETREDS